jgi:tetratricopeptide (TPR) repeat protein
MSEDSQNKTRISLRQKIILIIFGLFLTAVILEVGLRLGGFILLSLQESKNSASLKQKDSYRILCLGESTTQRQWPPILEDILNQSNIGVKLSVIDKGLSGTTTSVILTGLKSNLNAYQPDMVITMMGANDGATYLPFDPASDSKGMIFFKSFRIYKLTRLLWLHIVTKLKEIEFYRSVRHAIRIKPSSKQTALKQFYTKKNSDPNEELMRFKKAIELDPGNAKAYTALAKLYRNQGKFSEAEGLYKKAIELDPGNAETYIEWAKLYRDQGKFSEAEGLFKKAIELDPGNAEAYYPLARFYRNQGKFFEAEGLLKKYIEFNPGNAKAYTTLAEYYRHQGKFSEAEGLFRKAIELDPGNANMYTELAWLCRNQGKFSEAEGLFRKAIEFDPGYARAYIALARHYQFQGKFFEAEGLFRKAIELDPGNAKAYTALAEYYQLQGKFSEAEGFYKKAIEFDPGNADTYTALAWLYRDVGKFSEAEGLLKKHIEVYPGDAEAYKALARFYQHQGKFSEAEGLFKKAIELRPGDEWVYGELEVLYEEMGNPGLAAEYSRKANKVGFDYYKSITTANYHELKSILDKRGIIYVCVQYPMRSLKPLKKIFEGQQNIIFVDNEKAFKDAVIKEGYFNYFWDLLGGNWGHCTRKGNRLLAENIANVILKEVFGK